jgi:hypothetical protein
MLRKEPLSVCIRMYSSEIQKVLVRPVLRRKLPRQVFSHNCVGLTESVITSVLET